MNGKNSVILTKQTEKLNGMVQNKPPGHRMQIERT